MSGPRLSAITDGSSVRVRGDSSGGTIRATVVTAGQPFSAVNPAGIGPVPGTVPGAHPGGFTLVRSTGARLEVTTSASTLVVVPEVSPGQLPIGSSVFALGYRGPDGNLSAIAVTAVTRPTAGLHVRVSVKDCSPSSIPAAPGVLSAGRSSAG